MHKKTFWTLTLAILAFCVVVQIPAAESVYSQGRGNVTLEVIARRQAIENDPLAETPSAVWYVRPRTGGQFGPAAADVMRQWLKEGRA